jgi:chloramphenicol-sensitive protein RarD
LNFPLSRGLLHGLAAYSIWGLFPLYWRLFPQIPALQILAHRILWSFAVLAAIVIASWAGRSALRTVGRRVLAMYTTAAVLIGVNWFLYVYAVNADRVVETSLGYYVTPLVNVAMGVVVFRERLRMLQWIALVLASAGVVRLTLAYGAFPWIAAGLALSFGTYGLVKKKAPLASLDGLTLETAVLVVPAALYLAALGARGTGAFLAQAPTTDALLVAGGVVTVVPLLLFASAVRRVPLSVIGILQYISPTIQFLLGVFAFGEPFSRAQLAGFGLVWFGLALCAVDGWWARTN